MLSKLPELLGSLLRNDSDGLDRAKRDISGHDFFVASPGRLRAHYPGIDRNTLGNGQELRPRELDVEERGDYDKEDQIERTPPLYKHFVKLTKQCEKFMAGASQMLDIDAGEGVDDVEETMTKGMSLCGDIIAASDDIKRAMRVLGQATSSAPIPHSSLASGNSFAQGKGKETSNAVALERTYSMVCERLALKHVTIDHANYNYAVSLAQTQSATRKLKDGPYLIKELAMTATSLPPGVWVRVDEVRNDAMQSATTVYIVSSLKVSSSKYCPQ